MVSPEIANLENHDMLKTCYKNGFIDNELLFYSLLICNCKITPKLIQNLLCTAMTHSYFDKLWSCPQHLLATLLHVQNTLRYMVPLLDGTLALSGILEVNGLSINMVV